MFNNNFLFRFSFSSYTQYTTKILYFISIAIFCRIAGFSARSATPPYADIFISPEIIVQLLSVTFLLNFPVTIHSHAYTLIVAQEARLTRRCKIIRRNFATIISKSRQQRLETTGARASNSGESSWK